MFFCRIGGPVQISGSTDFVRNMLQKPSVETGFHYEKLFLNSLFL